MGKTTLVTFRECHASDVEVWRDATPLAIHLVSADSDPADSLEEESVVGRQGAKDRLDVLNVRDRRRRPRFHIVAIHQDRPQLGRIHSHSLAAEASETGYGDWHRRLRAGPQYRDRRIVHP